MASLLVICGLLAALLLLAVPVDLAFQLERTGAFRGRISVRWLLGLVRFSIPLSGSPDSHTEPNRKRTSGKPPSKRARRGKRFNVIAVLRQASFRRRVYRFIKDLVRATHPQQLRVSMRLGLGDPAETGCLWAFVGPLAAVVQTGAAMQNLRTTQVRIEPDFTDAIFEFNAGGQLRFIPLQFLILIIMFALSPASIKAWRTVAAGRA